MSKLYYDNYVDEKFNVSIYISSDDYDLLDIGDYVQDFIDSLRGYFL